MNELIQIPFNVRSRGALDIGMQFEHNARQVNFFGWSTEATPYFKIDDPVNLLIPLTVDYKFVVSYILTKEWYETTGQLIGIKNDGSYVNETGLFTVKCHKSVGEKPLAEYTDPEYDLVYAQMHEAYLELKEYTEKLKSDVESGKFNGKDGDNYILTEDDKEEIADITKDKIGIDNYVLKEDGKNLSTNDYTNEAKQKVDAIPQNPKYTDTVYDDTELKSKISNTYSKQEADTKFLTEHQDVSMFVTKAVTDLVNYYTKSNTYTKTEVNNLISAIPKFDIQVVTGLPTKPTNNISSTTIYLLSDSNTEAGNLYSEYIYVHNKWELLGSQTLDLSEYKKVYTFSTESSKPSDVSSKLSAGYICIATDLAVINNSFYLVTYNNVYRKVNTNITTVCCETTYWIDDDLYLIGLYGDTKDNNWTFKYFKIPKKATDIKIDDDYFGTDNVGDYISWLNDSLETEIAFSTKITQEDYDEINFDEEDDIVQKCMYLVYTDDTYTELVGIFVNGRRVDSDVKPSQGVDVQINGTSITKEVDGKLVANIPVASSSNMGVVKNTLTYGIGINQNGEIYVVNTNTVDIGTRRSYKALTTNMLDDGVKAAMTDGKGPEWTSEEKKAAQERIGIVQPDDIVTKDNIGEILKSGGNLGDKDDIALILRRLRIKYDVYDMLDPNKNDDLTGVHFVTDFTWYIPFEMVSHLMYVGDVYLMDLDNVFKVNVDTNTMSLVLYTGSVPAYSVYINPEYDAELNGYSILRYEKYTNDKPIIKVTDVVIDTPYVSIDVFQPYITDFLATGTKFSFDFSEIDPELSSLLTVEKLISAGVNFTNNDDRVHMLLQCSWNDTISYTTKDILLHVICIETEALFIINPSFDVENVNVGNTLTDYNGNFAITMMLPNIIRNKLPFTHRYDVDENTYTYSHTIYTNAGEELFVYKFMDDYTDTLYIGITDEGCYVYNREIENFLICLENIILEDINSGKTVVKEVEFVDAEMFKSITSLKVQSDFYLGEQHDRITQFYTNVSNDGYTVTGNASGCILINLNGILLVSIQSTILLSRGFNKIVFKLNTTAEPLPLD